MKRRHSFPCAVELALWSTRIAIAFVTIAAASLALGGQVTVTSMTDDLDFISDGACSLREAIITINDANVLGVGGCQVSGILGSNDTILLPAGEYPITRRYVFGCGPPACGALTISRDVAIQGSGARGTRVVSGNLGVFQNLFEVQDNTDVSFRDLTIDGAHEYPFQGISVANGNVTIDRVVIKRFLGDGKHGGGLGIRYGNATIADSLITDNLGDSGGGVGVFRGTLTVENSTIAFNTAQDEGGGVWASLSTVKLSSVTIVGNEVIDTSSAAVGGGVYAKSDADVRLENTIVAGNTVPSGASGADCAGAFQSFGYNLIGDGDACFGFVESTDQVGSSSVPIDPLLGDLANNGGTTDTLRLLAGSPAIDEGPPPGDPACFSADQRGLARPNDGNGDGVFACDVGAFEAPEGEQPPEANLEINLFDNPDPVGTSEPLRYQVLVTNHGPTSANDVTARFTEPAGATVTGFTSMTCALESTAPDTYACDLGTISAGATAGGTVNLTAPGSPTTILASATVESATPDPFPGDNQAQQSTVVVPSDSADVSMQIRAMGYEYVLITEAIEYELVVTNAGPDTATETTVTAQIPDGTVFVSASPECSFIVDDTLLTCTAGLVTSGASRTFDLVLGAPSQPGLVTLTSSVSTSALDPDTGNNSDAFTTTVSDVASADLFVSLGGPTEVETEGEFTINLGRFNNGPDASSSVEVRLSYPQGSEIVDAPAFCDILAAFLRCFIGELEPFGNFVSYPVTFQAPSTVGTIQFTGSIESGASIDPFTDNNVASLDVDVQQGAVVPPGDDVPELAVSRGAFSPDDATVDAGTTGVSALQVRVLNTSDIDAQVTSITLQASGTGDDSVGLAKVGLVLDIDGDGAVGAGDSLLATGVFQANDGDLVLSVSTAALAATYQDWLVVVDLTHASASRTAPLVSLGSLALWLGVVLARRRREWLVAGAMIVLSVSLVACGGPPPNDANVDVHSYSVALVDVQVGDLTGQTDGVVNGLPVEGATLRVPR